MNRKQLLLQLFQAAVDRARPERCLPPHLPRPDEVPGRLVVLGTGKAAAAMASVVERHWPRPLTGLVVVPHGQSSRCQQVQVLGAGHPLPDAASQEAARRMLALAHSLQPEDTALCLISGGGSALLALPMPGLSLQDLRAVNRALLASGAGISEMNILRRHLSAIKGGRLAAACHPARLLTLALSDVPGDHWPDIASGPTVADPSTCADALDVAQRYGIALPAAALQALRSGQAESVKPGDARLARARARLVATPQLALEAAADVAREHGYRPHILSDAVEGEAREVGKVLAALARQVATRQQPFAPPCAIISGGETTVTVRGNGVGGRNVECLLSFGLALGPQTGVHALMADTDGVDGGAPLAGAWLATNTLARAHRRGLDPRAALERNDAHTLFQALDHSIATGPTQTNVNDLRVILVDR